MPIPFPKLHIAASTINRILNALEDKESPLGLSAPEMAAPPMVPDPTIEGEAIDQQTAAPPPPVAATDPAMADQNMTLSSMVGGSPFDGALMP